MNGSIVDAKELKDVVTYEKGKPPVLQPYFGHDAELYLTPEYLRGGDAAEPIKANTKAVRIAEDDTIVLWDGSNAGEVFRGRSGILSSTMTRLKHSDLFNKKYFFYAVKRWEPFLKGQTSGSGIPHVDKEILGKLTVFNFQKPEQAEIAEILSTVDRLIEQTETLIAKQQLIKTGLMQDLLTRGIDEKGKLRSEKTHKFKNSPIGRVPEEWDVPTINDLAVHVGSGVTPRGGDSVYTSDGILFIRSQNVFFEGLRLSDAAYIPYRIHNTMKRSEVFENDVLLNITGASIGRCCSMPAIGVQANVNQHVCSIRLDKATQSDSGFLAAVISSSIGQNQIFQFNAGGNREGLNYQQVRSFLIPWPKSDERQRSHALIVKSATALQVLKHNLEKLRFLKTGLMQDLLTGEKRVTSLIEKSEAHESSQRK